MRRYILTLLVFSVCIVSAIGNQQTKSTGEIIVDGKKLVLPYAYCLKQDDFYQVIMLNHKLPEKDITNMFRNYPDDEIKISLLVPIVANPAMNGIAVDEYIANSVKLSMKAKPAKKGDAVEVTVSEIAIKPDTGRFKGKKVVIKGVFSAVYYGAAQYTY
ncbi:MAG TPA: hypothetical protein PKK43_08250 [Spirochaetota bacterium]|nr:hypothetical protein [Spirochaetota bacterium]